MKILFIEDNTRTADFVRRGLSEAGHTLEVASDGDAGIAEGQNLSYDVLIVDRMLPGCDGLEVVRRLRALGVSTPVLFLTALGDVDERVEGLDSGGDDYLAKPFALAELLARLHALGRRRLESRSPGPLSVGDLQMDLARHKVARANRAIDLTAQEFKLLAFFMERAGEIVTRTMLLEGLWHLNFRPRANVVDAHISRLRAKLDRGFDRELIRTVRGVGYILEAGC